MRKITVIIYNAKTLYKFNLVFNDSLKVRSLEMGKYMDRN